MRSLMRCLNTLPVRSLAEATRESKRLKVLDLTGSQDLLCVNLMCEKVGNPCICRLSLCLERLTAVEVLILANNNLSDIPSSMWKLRSLLELDLSGNCLNTLPPDVQHLQNLQVLKIVANPLLNTLPAEFQALTGLRELHIDKILLPALNLAVVRSGCNRYIRAVELQLHHVRERVTHKLEISFCVAVAATQTCKCLLNGHTVPTIRM